MIPIFAYVIFSVLNVSHNLVGGSFSRNFTGAPSRNL